MLWHFACLGWPVNDEDDVDCVNYDDHYIFIRLLNLQDHRLTCLRRQNAENKLES